MIMANPSFFRFYPQNIFLGGGPNTRCVVLFPYPSQNLKKNKMVGIVFKGVLEKQGKTENKHVLISLELENV